MTEAQLRREQVGLLTQGLDLPLPSVPVHVMQALAREFSASWDELGACASAQRERAEGHVNAALKNVLNRRLRERRSLVPGVLLDVALGEEGPSFDGAMTEGRPDLSLTLSERPLKLVAECKWIDPPQKTVRMYCEQGLARFVQGDYSWHQREAFMVAYVRDGSSVETCLLPHVEAARSRPSDPYATTRLHSGPVPALGPVRSTHARSFTYAHAESAGRAPGDIEVWHLWLALT